VKKLIIVAALAFVFGCSIANEKSSVVPTESESSPSESSEKTGEMESAVLKTINVSLYSTKHPEKAQPMLINVISEPDEIKVYDTNLKKNVLVELAPHDISDVYYLQLEYVKNGVSVYKDILYAKSSENKEYYKEFKMDSKYSYDKFDEQTKETFIQLIGKSDWYLLADHLPI